MSKRYIVVFHRTKQTQMTTISERFRQFYFSTKRSTLLVKDNRKTKFEHSFSVEQKAKLLPFCLCLSFRLKVKKRYLFWKKKVGIFRFWVNDILTSILSALHSFLTFPNNFIKREKGTFFFGFKRSHERRKKVPFLQLEVTWDQAQFERFSYILSNGYRWFSFSLARRNVIFKAKRK